MAETRPQKVMLKVFGGEEVLENPSLIDYYRLHQVDQLFLNKLLGDFTPEGKYDIPEETKKILIKVKKLITEVSANMYLATSQLKYITLNFSVKYWKTENNQAVANLYLTEKLEGADLVCFIAQYVSEYNDDFKERVKKAFNLFNEIEDFEDEYSQKIDEICEIQKQKKAEREYIVEIQSEFYIKEMLRLLEQSGENGKAIIEEFKPIMENALAQTNKSGVFQKLRLKLDNLIIKSGGFNKFAQENPDFIRVSLIYSKPVKRFDTVSKKLDDAQAPKPVKSTKATSSKAGKSSPTKSLIIIPKAKNKLQAPKSYLKMPGGSKSKGGSPLTISPKGPTSVELPKDSVQSMAQTALVNQTINADSIILQDEMAGNFKSMLFTSEDRALESCSEKSRENVSFDDGLNVQDVFNPRLSSDEFSLNR